jgi:alkylated DNA repair dioxygenase AlkB
MSTVQLAFWNQPPALPDGFEYRADLLSQRQEAELLDQLRELDFREFEFHGYHGKRRVASFGLHYDFDQRTLRAAEEIPDFLFPLREIAADFARIAAAALEHVLVAEYPPGAGIGWHRDRPAFGDVIGVSFGSPCRFRLRRKRGSGWERAALLVEPRSAYLLRGPARSEWEHSIPPGERLRYSVTFRSVRAKLGLPAGEHSR